MEKQACGRGAYNRNGHETEIPGGEGREGLASHATSPSSSPHSYLPVIPSPPLQDGAPWLCWPSSP